MHSQFWCDRESLLRSLSIGTGTAPAFVRSHVGIPQVRSE